MMDNDEPVYSEISQKVKADFLLAKMKRNFMCLMRPQKGAMSLEFKGDEDLENKIEVF